jgi:hypothetical protein
VGKIGEKIEILECGSGGKPGILEILSAIDQEYALPQGN